MATIYRQGYEIGRKTIDDPEDLLDQLGKKVDKEEGKGLSTNDLTDELKKTYDDAVSALENKVDKEDGKGLSTNDLTTELKQTYDAAAAAVGEKVTKEDGKGLSTNDFTNAYKNTLDNLDTNYIAATEKGVSIPTLVGGKIPSDYLPGSLEDIQEYDSLDQFPTPSVDNKNVLYVALDTGITYRCTGTSYVALGGGGTVTSAMIGTKVINPVNGQLNLGNLVNKATLDARIQEGISITLDASGNVHITTN